MGSWNLTQVFKLTWQMLYQLSHLPSFLPSSCCLLYHQGQNPFFKGLCVTCFKLQHIHLTSLTHLTLTQQLSYQEWCTTLGGGPRYPLQPWTASRLETTCCSLPRSKNNFYFLSLGCESLNPGLWVSWRPALSQSPVSEDSDLGQSTLYSQTGQRKPFQILSLLF